MLVITSQAFTRIFRREVGISRPNMPDALTSSLADDWNSMKLRVGGPAAKLTIRIALEAEAFA